MKKKQCVEVSITSGPSYGNYMSLLYKLLTPMFEWDGLPDTTDPRYLELELFCNGTATVLSRR